MQFRISSILVLALAGLSVVGCDPDVGSTEGERVVPIADLTDEASVRVDAALLGGLAPGQRLLIDMQSSHVIEITIDRRDQGLDLSRVDLVFPGGEKWVVSEWIDAGMPNPTSAGVRCKSTTISILWGLIKITRETVCEQAPHTD